MADEREPLSPDELVGTAQRLVDNLVRDPSYLDGGYLRSPLPRRPHGTGDRWRSVCWRIIETDTGTVLTLFRAYRRLRVADPARAEQLWRWLRQHWGLRDSHKSAATGAQQESFARAVARYPHRDKRELLDPAYAERARAGEEQRPTQEQRRLFDDDEEPF